MPDLLADPVPDPVPDLCSAEAALLTQALDTTTQVLRAGAP